MSRTTRRIAWIAAFAAGILLAAAVAAVLVVRSQWFYGKVRQLIVSNVETATGGRVEVQSFRFAWAQMRAEIRGFVLHGLEPAEKPPLFRASSIAVGIKIVSVFERKVDIRYLEVAEPRVYLIIGRDGRTNVPEPKIKRAERPALETILDLAIGRFDLENGLFEVESRGAVPFEGHGRNLNARFLYEAAGPRYRGEIAMAPLEIRWPGWAPVPLGVDVSAAIERNRIGITAAKLTTGESRVEFSGAIEDLAAPHGRFQYNARLAVPDGARILHLPELKRGTVEVGGNAMWRGASEFAASGNLRVFGLDFQDSSMALRDCRLESALTANPRGIELTGARFSGDYARGTARIPASGRAAAIALRGRELDLRGLAVSALGGSFEGSAHLRDRKFYTVEGTIAGFEARRAIALYSPQTLPWDAQASGSVRLSGTLGNTQDLQLAANLDIAPAGSGAPVDGTISANYEARGGTLDLGSSTLSLPSSRADFSGVLGRSLTIHLETHDLNDLLPALGKSAASFPVKLENGSAVFDGTVTGNLEKPQIAGKLAATHFSYEGKAFDSFRADVDASPESVKLENAAVARGNLRAQFSGSIGPREWKIDDASPIAVNGSIANADIAELAALLDAGEVPVTGSLTAKGQVAGTVAKPVVTADAEAVKGALRGEPFDRLSVHATYGGRRLEVTSGELTAGPKNVRFSGTFDHAANRFDQGRLAFQLTSNTMPLDQIHTLQEMRPGVKGTVQVSASGAVDVANELRVIALNAEVTGSGLQLTGQSLGNAHLTATSQGPVLDAKMESDFANSVIRGEGQWRLEGDYPGSATITFSRLDFAQLRDWIAPSGALAAAGGGERTPPFAGSAEGELHISGPAMKPPAMKAELRIPKLEIAPPPATAASLGKAAESYTLHNSGPIVATMENSVITVANAHLMGRDTDLNVAGRVSIDQKSPLDLRVDGRIDLGIVRDFEPDITSSGTIAADAAIRGPLASPQVTGRIEFQKASFNMTDFPNGISNASGVILFIGDRATIQSFRGETGGGTVEIAGSATYGGGQPVFQLRATVKEVRVRYPEGVSTVADANLRYTGTTDRSMLSGTITVVRTGFNPQSDFGSLIARSSEPVRTPSARTGFLGGLNFDIQINTSPDLQVQSSLTEDMQVEASLRLRGSFSNPAVLGRINITQGQLVFYGTKYAIDSGSIAFYNPLRIDPIINIDLTTKVRAIDITLSVTGPLSKPKLTPRSDPPLEFNEIVALLATGRAPTSDPAALAQQNTAPQSWQQMGASALLGQAIASPVTGRLQRFFGVSQLRIDPTAPGVETNNPQARITIEKQVTPSVTMTYITYVNTTNPDIVRLEWAVSKQWSVVLLRDENGVGSMDFFFKRRF